MIDRKWTGDKNAETSMMAIEALKAQFGMIGTAHSDVNVQTSRTHQLGIRLKNLVADVYNTSDLRSTIIAAILGQEEEHSLQSIIEQAEATGDRSNVMDMGLVEVDR